jgi:uracil-DNA glycosylase
MSFADIVSRIKNERGLAKQVPGFDPSNGNEDAKYLFLLEAPGPGALDTGMISFDNPDPTASNFRNQLSRAGITRDETAADVHEGMEYLDPLIAAMRYLRCVVLVGSAARRAHMHLSRITTARIVTCHHPSARAHARNQHATNENIELFCYLKTSL